MHSWLVIFQMLIVSLYILFCKASIQIFCLFIILLFFLLLSCKLSLYNLEASDVSDVYILNVFSQSVAYLFTFVKLSQRAVIFNLDEAQISIFYVLVFYVLPKNSTQKW